MPISHKQGDTLLLSAVRTDSNGDPVALSGLTILSQIKYGTETSVELTTEVTSEALGTFNLSALPAQTQDIPAGRYSFDVQFTDGDGAVASTVTDTLTILEDNTRSV